MSQPILEQMLLQLADEVGDTVTTATADGKMFTGARRLRAINEALVKYYDTLYIQLKPDIFIEAFPHYVAESGTLTITANKIAKPSKCRYIKSILINHQGASSVVAKRLKPDVYQEAVNETDNVFSPSAIDNKFFEKGTEILLFAGASITGTAVLVYLREPETATVGASEIDMPSTWSYDVINIAKQILLSQQQLI